MITTTCSRTLRRVLSGSIVVSLAVAASLGTAGSEVDALGPLVGAWDVTNRSGQPDGTVVETAAVVEISVLRTRVGEGIREVWRDAADGTHMQTTDRLRLPDEGRWSTRSTAAYPAMMWAPLTTVAVSAGVVTLPAIAWSDPTGDHMQRGRLEFPSAETFSWLLERSYDGGASWFAIQRASGQRRPGTRPAPQERVEGVASADRDAAGGTVTTRLEEFSGSRGLAIDDAGGLYVGALFAGAPAEEGPAVVRLAPDGGVEFVARGLRPAGLAWAAGRLYVHAEDVEPGRIVRIDADGAVVEIARVGGASLTADRDGFTYTHTAEDAILRISPDGEVETYASAPGLGGVLGMAFDHDTGVLYAAEFTSGRVHAIDRSGTARMVGTVPSYGGGGAAWLAFHDGVLFATGFGAAQVFGIDVDTGAVHVVAGSGVFGHRDGPADQARFESPNGIAATPDGLWIADLGRVRGGTWSHNRLRFVRFR